MTEKHVHGTDTEMTCQELVELITDYLDGTLGQSDRSRFEAHLQTCSGCTAYIDQMRSTIRLLGKLSEESISADARYELLATFRTWKANGAGNAESRSL
jgi:anti-sigma factor RsiW